MLVKFPHSPILLLNKFVFPMAKYCFWQFSLSVTHSAAPRVPFFCSYHILTSSVIYYWTDANPFVNVPPVKALTRDLVHYLNVLGPWGLFAFNLRSLCERCCEAKLKLVVSCSDLSTERRVALSSRFQRNHLWKKSVKSLRFCGKWFNSFLRPWHCLQMQAETAWTLKSSFVSVMLIEHHPLLTLYQKLLIIFSFILEQSIHLNSDAELQIYPKMENEFTSKLFISMTFTLTRVTSHRNIIKWHYFA